MTLEILTSDSLAPVRHGFFTRLGGASSGIFSGLNCGTGSSDQSDVVCINRTRVAEAMGTTADCLVGVHQVHSADVITVSAPMDERPRADAMVTRIPGLVLTVLTADCQPVLFADATAGVIGAAHAGWRGLTAGVLEAAVDALPVPPGELLAWIGPGIDPDAYQVGPEVRAPFAGTDALAACFSPDGDDRYRADLKTLATRLLERAGVGAITDSGLCTHADAERFYSHRRDGTTGRMATVIWLE